MARLRATESLSEQSRWIIDRHRAQLNRSNQDIAEVEVRLGHFPISYGGSTDVRNASNGERSRGPGTGTTGPPAGWHVPASLPTDRDSVRS
ncbi:MAG: hypothetical protein IID36_06630 [Planctomycetes bacterium]|nr:hypothetical protein [Planctomycetota bacterium]